MPTAANSNAMPSALSSADAASAKRKNRISVHRQLRKDENDNPPVVAAVSKAAEAAATSVNNNNNNNDSGTSAHTTNRVAATSKRSRSVALTDAPARVAVTASASERLQPSVPQRIGSGRIKKARVPFDPSVEPSGRRRGTMPGGSAAEPPNNERKQPLPVPVADEQQEPPLKRPAISQSLGECGLCQHTGATGNGRAFSVCKVCKYNRVHVGCYRAENVEHWTPKESDNWQCDSCLTCSQCYETSIMVSVPIMVFICLI